MLKRLKAWLQNALGKATKRSEWAPFKGQGFLGIPLEGQILKRTHFKPGDTYKIGEAIVTVHENKESMLAAIAATDKRRSDREARLTEKAIDIMLMTPEQLKQFKLDEWLAGRKTKESTIRSIVGKFLSDSYLRKLEAKYAKPPPLGKVAQDSKVAVPIKEKV